MKRSAKPLENGIHLNSRHSRTLGRHWSSFLSKALQVFIHRKAVKSFVLSHTDLDSQKQELWKIAF